MALVFRTVSSIVIASRAKGEWDFLWLLSRGFFPALEVSVGPSAAHASAGEDGQLDLEASSGRGAVGGMNAAPGGRDDGAGDGQAQPAMGGRPVAVPETVDGAGGV